jgi:amino acid permease
MIYKELEARHAKQMSKVLWLGSGSAVLLYAFVGIFGYLTFVNYVPGGASEALKDKNILEAPYPNVTAITVGNFALLFAVIAASPLVVLPAKDTVEEFWFKGITMTRKQNLTVTFLIVFVCYALAMFIPNIGDAMTIVGSTTNPAVGFILPIVFYWRIMNDKPTCSFSKMIALLVAVVIIIVSILSLIDFTMGKIGESPG